mgnify:CR=1 FL=1
MNSINFKGRIVFISLVLLALAFFVLIILLVSRIIIPQISKFIVVFTNEFPDIYKEIINFLAGLSKEFPSIQSKLLASNLDAQEILKKLVSLSTTWAGGILNIINSVFSAIANIVIALIIAIYILASKEGLKSQFTRLFATFVPQHILDRLYYLLKVTDQTFKAFFVGQFLEAIILGVLCSVGLLWISLCLHDRFSCRGYSLNTNGRCLLRRTFWLPDDPICEPCQGHGLHSIPNSPTAARGQPNLH